MPTIPLQATSLFPKETSTLLDIGMSSQEICRIARLTLNSRNLTSVSGRKLFVVYVRSPSLGAVHISQSVRTAEQKKDWESTAINRSSKQSKKTLLLQVRSFEGHQSPPCAEAELPGHGSEANIPFAHHPVD